MKNKISGIAKLALAVSLSTALYGCVIHVGGGNGEDWGKGSHTSILGDIEIAEGRSVGDLTSVNGDIQLYERVYAESIDVVNGDIEVGSNSTIGKIDSVNGDIDLAQEVTIERGINSVNGDIELSNNSAVKGGISSVNGDIELLETKVDEDIETVNGDVELRSGSIVSGDIVFKRNRKDNWGSDRPKLIIDESSDVKGRIVLHRPVELILANKELEAKVDYFYED